MSYITFALKVGIYEEKKFYNCFCACPGYIRPVFRESTGRFKHLHSPTIWPRRDLLRFVTIDLLEPSKESDSNAGILQNNHPSALNGRHSCGSNAVSLGYPRETLDSITLIVGIGKTLAHFRVNPPLHFFFAV